MAIVSAFLALLLATTAASATPAPIDADLAITGRGWLILVLGAAACLVVGAILMMLMLHSHRNGYDEDIRYHGRSD